MRESQLCKRTNDHRASSNCRRLINSQLRSSSKGHNCNARMNIQYCPRYKVLISRNEPLCLACSISGKLVRSTIAELDHSPSVTHSNICGLIQGLFAFAALCLSIASILLHLTPYRWHIISDSSLQAFASLGLLLPVIPFSRSIIANVVFRQPEIGQ